MYRKTSTALEFEEIQPFPFVNAPGKVYGLRGVIEHRGGVEGGHYVAYVHWQAQWFECDDDEIERVPLATVLKAEAYTLLYEELN